MLIRYGASFRTVCWRKQTGYVHGKTKGRQRLNVTWWWNNDVANIIKEKQHLFKIYDKSRKSDSDKARVEENKRKFKNIRELRRKQFTRRIMR